MPDMGTITIFDYDYDYKWEFFFYYDYDYEYTSLQSYDYVITRSQNIVNPEIFTVVEIHYFFFFANPCI
jgi:hypothetical protein